MANLDAPTVIRRDRGVPARLGAEPSATDAEPRQADQVLVDLDQSDLEQGDQWERSENRPSARVRWAWIPAGLLLAGLVALNIDLPTAQFLRTWSFRWKIYDLIGNAEPFGHTFGVFILLVAMWQLDPRGRRKVPRVLAAALLAGGVCALLKHLVVRVRPRDMGLNLTSVWETWVEPATRTTSTSIQSFPSGHTGTAVALAVVLGQLYPRARGFFWMLAVLVALGRIMSCAHFPSDVLGGAAVGWLIGQLVIALPSSWFWRGPLRWLSEYQQRRAEAAR